MKHQEFNLFCILNIFKWFVFEKLTRWLFKIRDFLLETKSNFHVKLNIFVVNFRNFWCCSQTISCYAICSLIVCCPLRRLCNLFVCRDCCTVEGNPLKGITQSLKQAKIFVDWLSFSKTEVQGTTWPFYSLSFSLFSTCLIFQFK